MAEWIIKRTRDGTMTPTGELIRCKDCGNKECDSGAGKITCRITGESHGRLWYCADSEPKEGEQDG